MAVDIEGVEPEQESLIEQAMAEDRLPFDPSPHLVNLNGRGEYLEVKWRLVWLRRAHPDAAIETELAQGGTDSNFAVFRASVKIPGGGSATGWGSETAKDFGDFLEKAETKAIGRALAALGYGTQFCLDHEGGAGMAQHTEGRSQASGQYRIVDAPVSFAKRADFAQGKPDQHQQYQRRDQDGARDSANGGGGDSQRATERQVKFIYALAREAGLDERELAAWSTELFACDVEQLNRRDASALIEAIRRRQQERG